MVAEPVHLSQRWWSQAIYTATRQALAKGSPLRDQCRLALQGMSNTTAWMEWVPGQEHRVTFGSSEYKLLLRWWLGAPLLAGDAGQPCPCCGGPLDNFGDHLVSCVKNHPTLRHNAVRDAFQVALSSMGIACRREVRLPFALDRPGDLALDNLDNRGSVLVDLTAHHPLAPGKRRTVEGCLHSLIAVENAKVQKYEADCLAVGFVFAPLGFHCWGGLGPLGSSLINRIVKQLVGDTQGWKRIQMTLAIRHTISANLMRFVASQLLPALSVQPVWTLPPQLFEADAGGAI